ncbi:hypothetical protein AB0D46_24975 [Streptomyces sp. NPDC048383]|uniref:ATP-grasp domain-containing protein n=1 Tax=Streptomyces sp. NPDC048383 TaxID=3155386 RepID=UPI003419A0E6
MKILILQKAASSSPCDRWIAEEFPHAEIRILGERESVRSGADLDPRTERLLLDDHQSDEFTRALFDQCRTWRPDRILSNSEFDVLRAAEARSIFGIPGQKSASALCFRDKVEMKDLFARAGIAAVPYAVPGCADDLFADLAAMGSVVVKPRLGAGSVGVRLLDCADDVRTAYAADPAFPRGLHEGQLMLEQFASTDVYHVDVVVSGQTPFLVSPSRYLHPPHKFADFNTSSAMLDEESRDFKVLDGLARDFVHALPRGHGATVLHLEFYKMEDGSFLAGEVACRAGGALVEDSILHTYGVDIGRMSFLIACGIAPPEPLEKRLAPPTAWSVATARPIASAGECPDWVIKREDRGTPGAASNSVDGEQVLIEAADHRGLLARLDELNR